MNNISIIVPILNEQENLHPLLDRISKVLSAYAIEYEIIFIDDHSTDKSREFIEKLAQSYPVQLYIKQGRKGKAQSLIEGFAHAKYNQICMIDADLQYPPEAIPDMLKKLSNNEADIVIANRSKNEAGYMRQFISDLYQFFFAKLLHKLDYDVQSGLKVFRKQIIERITLDPLPWTFDLEFLIKARDARYKISQHDITFAPRHKGKTKINILNGSLQIGLAALYLKLIRPDIIPFHAETKKLKGSGFHYKGQEFIHHSELHHQESAFHRLSGIQVLTLLFILVTLTESLILFWHITIVIILAGLTALYFIDLLFNLFLVHRSISHPTEIHITKTDLSSINEQNWPSYTIFCPLYKEAHILPQFVEAMKKLDYPKDKLQIILLLEENDPETIAKAREYNLPYYFYIYVVPHSMPKTKPKACNYGLLHATGEYVVIFDAEDSPDPLQLKKAVLAFQKAGKKTACVQAKLNFYNPHQNLLTQVFTAEYSLWFDLILTGLQSINAPIPLGGTSNHFRTSDLKKLNGWDSFNVTEDCDLGIRLVKQGYHTAIIDSVTLEEANSSPKNWLFQRTRWIKGYMQSYLVHMRNPRELYKNWREPHILTFQLVVGGKIISMFINPIMWIITFSYFTFRAQTATFIESFFPTPILYMGVFSLLVGNFLYLYYYMIGSIKHGHYHLLKYIIFIPFYWLAMSIAAWVAVFELITAPHHWSKTKHGLHLNNKRVVAQAHTAIGSI
jgi:cellulose synthase/poly-beta-1,6-N-acetylglucosamine synthase-like glycosyltransferase